MRVSTKKATGSHYTPSRLAGFVAKELQTVLRKTPSVRILDPAIGDGELVLALLNQLSNEHMSIEVIGFDTDETALRQAKERILRRFNNVTTDFRHVDFLEFANQHYQPSLFSSTDFRPVDIVISNPPYIRTQVIGAEKSQKLAHTFKLSGRIDIAFAFIKAIKWMLKPNGIAGIIISNRFMTTKAGRGVRTDLQQNFHIHHIWDLGDTKLFKAAVLPAVLLLEKKNDLDEYVSSRFSTIYATECTTTQPQKFTDVIEAVSAVGVVEISNGQCFNVQHGYLAEIASLDEVWRISTDESKAWLEIVREHTYCHFGELGKIRVGVKTTADKVFIRDDWQTFDEKHRPELLKPVITHHIGRRFRALKALQQRQILYTHERHNGKRQAIDLADYPKSARYLERNRNILEARKYITKAKRNWYEIWVPQDPNEWRLPKLVFRDIVKHPMFWADFSGAVVNGDCYWMTLDSRHPQEMLWLALAVGNSTFIEEFYDYRFNNKLYAGRRRYITQYVQKFPLPDPQTIIAQEIIEQSRQVYEKISITETSRQEKYLDKLVWEAFGF